MVAALKAADDTLRVGVTRVLMEMEDPRAESLFTGLLTDSSWMVRSASALGLGLLATALHYLGFGPQEPEPETGGAGAAGPVSPGARSEPSDQAAGTPGGDAHRSPGA